MCRHPHTPAQAGPDGEHSPRRNPAREQRGHDSQPGWLLATRPSSTPPTGVCERGLSGRHPGPGPPGPRATHRRSGAFFAHTMSVCFVRVPLRTRALGYFAPPECFFFSPHLPHEFLQIPLTPLAGEMPTPLGRLAGETPTPLGPLVPQRAGWQTIYTSLCLPGIRTKGVGAVVVSST